MCMYLEGVYTDYLTCKAVGLAEGQCARSSSPRYGYALFRLQGVSTNALAPIVNWFVVVAWRDAAPRCIGLVHLCMYLLCEVCECARGNR